MPSSPRERGSSPWTGVRIERWDVVPARAGVIRGGHVARSGRDGRPRASGGHPAADVPWRTRMMSSPRERGSSRGRGAGT